MVAQAGWLKGLDGARVAIAGSGPRTDRSRFAMSKAAAREQVTAILLGQQTQWWFLLYVILSDQYPCTGASLRLTPIQTTSPLNRDTIESGSG